MSTTSIRPLLRDALIGVTAPVAQVTYRERPRLRVVVFHDTPPDRERVLRERLARLAARHAIVSLGDAFARSALDRDRLNIALTFDDGLKEHHAVAARVLDDLGLTATFFVPTGALDLDRDGAVEFSHTALRRSKAFEFMSSSELRELADNPLFEIGGHTATHPDLSGADDLKAELSIPKETLEGTTGRPVRWFAYPFGSPRHASAAAIQAIRTAGYEAAFTIVPSFWSVQDSPFLVGRDALTLDGSQRSWDGFLRGGYDALSTLKYRRALADLRRGVVR